MLRRCRQLLPVLLTCLLAVGLAAPLAADAATTAPAPTASGPQATVNVKVNVDRFVVDGTQITALGYATSTVSGRKQTRAVRLKVSRTLRCSVLALNLKELKLQLLGLHVDVGTVNLTIKGDPTRSLGALFCKLSHAISLKSAVGTKSAVTSLNRSLRGRPMPMLAFSTRIGRVAAAGTSCKVLDLTLGPLHLDLVGLIVDLYGATTTKPVEVHVTADPAGGVLGSTFCRLATAS